MGGPSDPPYPQAGKPYGGYVPPQTSRFHTRAGFVCGLTMWLWVFYRAKQDLPALLVCYLYCTPPINRIFLGPSSIIFERREI